MEYLQNASLCLDNKQENVVQKRWKDDTDSSTVLERKRTSPKTQQSAARLISPVTRLLRNSAALVNNTVLSIRDGLTEEQRMAKQKLEEKKQILHLRLKHATNIYDWKAAARDLDIITGNESWKASEESGDFDAPLIEKRLCELDEARINCDVTRMLYLVRTALSRDLGGMGNISLYRNSYIGTKNLIERYIDSALDTIRSLVKIASSNITLPDGLETKDVLEQLVYARQAFGRSALLLSGGATFGMNHVGVLKAMFEARLLPRIISGSSAGSIVCAVLCTRTDEELPGVLKEFPYGNLAVFEEKERPDTILERVRRFLTQGALIDIRHLSGVMRELLGDMTFQEAYNRSRRILNICVSSASAYELPRLLNYITSPNIMIWSAVAASCSVPLVFSPAPLLAKNPLTGEHCPWESTPQKWIDGSVDNDLPMTRLAEMFNVNHFIVSQVNPHVIPFLARDEELISHVQQPSSAWDPSSLICTITDLAKGEALHRMNVLADMGIFPNMITKCQSVLSQKYSGDITILPEIDLGDVTRMLKNPTTEFMCRTCLAGERATWPKLSRIRNHCAVELELDLAVQELRARVVFSPSQVNLRRLSTGAGLTSKAGDRGRARRSPIARNSSRTGRMSGNPSPQRKGARPPIWRAASHYGGSQRRRTCIAVGAAAEELSNLEIETPTPGSYNVHPNTAVIPRNKTTGALDRIGSSFTQYDGDDDDDDDPSPSSQPRSRGHSTQPQNHNHTSRKAIGTSDYFSGLESEATQDGSLSPASRLHDSSDGDEDDDDDDDEDDDVESRTDDSSPEPYVCQPPPLIPRNSISEEPSFLFSSQAASTSYGFGGGGSAPAMSPLLKRKSMVGEVGGGGGGGGGKGGVGFFLE